jgi:hypothetical protein
MSIIAGISTTTTLASAQAVSASFNPQAQFPVGSTPTIQSVYGMATAMPSHNQTRPNRPHPRNSPTNDNQPPVGDQKPQEGLLTYSASVTVKVQIASDDSNGGVQLTVQGGAIVINGVTFTITDGNGEMSNLDRLMMNGNAKSVNGQSFKWSMEGLAALHNGVVIGDLTGNAFASIDSDNTPADVNVTYITTMS